MLLFPKDWDCFKKPPEGTQSHPVGNERGHDTTFGFSCHGGTQELCWSWTELLMAQQAVTSLLNFIGIDPCLAAECWLYAMCVGAGKSQLWKETWEDKGGRYFYPALCQKPLQRKRRGPMPSPCSPFPPASPCPSARKRNEGFC